MILITLQNKESYGIVELRPKGSACDHTVRTAKVRERCGLILNLP